MTPARGRRARKQERRKARVIAEWREMFRQVDAYIEATAEATAWLESEVWPNVSSLARAQALFDTPTTTMPAPQRLRAIGEKALLYNALEAQRKDV